MPNQKLKCRCRFKVASSETPDLLLNYIREAISARLFVPGWLLHEDFTLALENLSKSRVKKISLAYDAKNTSKPIGVALQRGIDIKVFVRKQYRRKKVGTRLIRRIATGNHWTWDWGIDGSGAFFKKVRKEKVK